MEARAGQVRNARLQGVEAVVEREQRPLTEGHNDGFLLRREHGRARLTRPHRGIFDGRTLAPANDEPLDRSDVIGGRLRLSPSDLSAGMLWIVILFSPRV